MTKEDLSLFLKERGATVAQIEMLEQGMSRDVIELAQKCNLVPGQEWLEQRIAETRAKFVVAVRWNEAQEKGMPAIDLEALL